MKLENISTNLTLILQELVKSQTICKYLNYDQKNPLSQPNLTLPYNSLIMTKIFPYPFDTTTVTTDMSNIRVYYPKGDFTNAQIIENTDVFFDIIVSKSKDLWLVNDGQALIRPYEIMKAIYNDLHNKSVSTLGKLRFKRFVHVPVNEKFDCIRLVAEMFTVG